jgi:hypothetical protein
VNAVFRDPARLESEPEDGQLQKKGQSVPIRTYLHPHNIWSSIIIVCEPHHDTLPAYVMRVESADLLCRDWHTGWKDGIGRHSVDVPVVIVTELIMYFPSESDLRANSGDIEVICLIDPRTFEKRKGVQRFDTVQKYGVRVWCLLSEPQPGYWEKKGAAFCSG